MLAPVPAAPTNPVITSPLRTIPDAESVANNPDLHGADLNHEINKTYVKLSEQMQMALDPRFDENPSEVAPSWYAMAIYASRGAGRGMLAAENALKVVADQQRPMAAVRAAFPKVPAEDWERLGLDEEPRGGNLSQATAFLVAFFLGQQDGDQRLSLDPRVLSISANRLCAILDQPGVSLGTVANTILKMMEDGNRRIFQDIGVAAQHFLELRSDTPNRHPRQVIEHFSERPELSDRAYQDGLRWAAGQDPLPTNFGQHYTFETRHLLATGMALYQRASAEKEPQLRDRLIAHAGNLLAYHEQYTVAVPAFLPDQIKPGETDRQAVMQVLTPQVDVKTRNWRWDYSQFDQEDLDDSWWTPPCTERNWGIFADRWPPILNYFELCFQSPQSLWPMPNPNPAQGVD